MDKVELLNEILAIIKQIQDDEEKLSQVHTYLMNEIVEEETCESIPEEYKEITREIASNLDAGWVCFYNPDTKEIEGIPQNLVEDPDCFEMETGEEVIFEHLKWPSYISFDPPSSHFSYGVMEKFTAYVDDVKLRDRLEYALSNRKPFAHFRDVIDNSGWRDKWFSFKQEMVVQYVWEMLSHELQMPAEDIPFIGGFFNDDGTRIDPNKVPIPNLCVVCKKHTSEDPGEDILCTLNRNGQANDEDFKCGAFEKI